MFKKLFTDLLGISTSSCPTVTGVLGALLSYSFGGGSEVLG
ncbi:hypothetical protein [Paenibacillus phytorum]|nr:hypothetical protein [Paenibacillus phytorum]